MDKTKLWEMAIDSGLCDRDLGKGRQLMTDYGDATDAVERFAARIEAAEREACKERLKEMYKAKRRESCQGVSLGYEPRLKDYLDAL